jgi:GR25 family glycosyltransferase involved in LPS biosynthesis
MPPAPGGAKRRNPANEVVMTKLGDEFSERFDCFVVNLERQPERLRDFLDRSSSTGIRFQIFPAVDGHDASNAELRAPHFIAAHVRNYTPGALGNALSHRRLWQRCAATEQPIIVFEDDAWIRTDFRSIVSAAVPERTDVWDIIFCGYNFDTILEFELVPGCNLRCGFSVKHPTVRDLVRFVDMTGPASAHRLRNAFGTCGYIISPNGAAKLAAACFPLDNTPIPIVASQAMLVPCSLDSMMNGVLANMNAWVCVPPLVLTQNDPAASTTVRRDDASAKAEVRRNEPCPCGSGKRYKHCHGRAPASPPGQ